MSIFTQLMWFFRANKRLYIYGLSFLFLTEISQMVSPALLGSFTDRVIAREVTPEILLLYAGGILFFAILMYGFRYAWITNIFQGSALLEKTLRQQLFDHYMQMDTTFYQRHRTGDLMAHASNDLSAIQRVASGGILMLVDSLVIIVFTVISMIFVVDWRLTLIGVLPLPLLVIGVRYLSPKIREAFTASQEAFSELSNKSQESIAGIKAIKTLGQESQDVQAFEKEVTKTIKINKRVALIDSLFGPMATVIMTISYVIMMTYGGSLVVSNEITIGQLVSFATYLGLLVWPMFGLGQLFNVLERGNASYMRVQDILMEKSAIVEDIAGIDTLAQGNIKIDIESFVYPDDSDTKNALKNVHIDIKSGETLGIVGRVGSGKTTLLKLLLRQFDHYEGSIKIGNIDIKSYRFESYLRTIGYVAQENFLFSDTVANNIRFADVNKTQENVELAAKKAAFHEDVLKFPERYETEVGEHGVSLSGGQKQRLAIARALIINPEILILDDALSAVDARTEKQILSALKAERQEKTTIIAAHRMSSVMNADKIIVFEQGEIIESGTHAELMLKQGWYAQMYKQQQLVTTLVSKLDGQGG
ncbi:ATP-binding cassette domain-containing protein [Leuconostoc carnosum]|uniref:ABC transporter ATP-binding protein n=1 Tax=Leuconostoc carnosum TaxID=1252 RepID=UPI000D51BCC6|nr:ABC transporter transmembrane domain-containing protein [Leuconostoc carnosum]KAA8364312.1 ATP-binding cassette domain-containing protein [Leuconostoc carnosum]KAA8367205.1 ATP-binding cassette domain-containing protein [Leuconostoc carnosum]KAA8369583.1 ATP-binding cassette domain-containing protein [Leuconostoc carnosum]KAA8375029.1 ATP-binding cassette domain-containing protein [Leuconostoc carnosum]KAA8375382.1 ATP-binding cassette domain-containing protein [Leuconostoc carnosum]